MAIFQLCNVSCNDNKLLYEKKINCVKKIANFYVAKCVRNVAIITKHVHFFRTPLFFHVNLFSFHTSSSCFFM